MRSHLLLEFDFFRHDTGLSHDAEPHCFSRIHKSIRRAIGQGFAFAFKTFKLTLQLRLLYLALNESLKISDHADQ